MKTALILGIVLILILPVAYYLISPAFIVIEADETSPLAGVQQTITATESNKGVRDNLEAMDAETRADFESQIETMSKQITVMDDTMPVGTRLVAQGTFKPRAHDVEGQVLLIETDGKRVLRFEDFETINGPELHIYLSADLNDNDFVDLGIIKATKGNVNYDVPGTVDLERYRFVQVWCKPFGVLFSYAELE